MPILFPLKLDNGVSLSYHVVSGITIDPASPSATAAVTLCSWPSEEDFVLANGGRAAWFWPPVLVPRTVVGDADLNGAIERHLVGEAEGMFSGGSVMPFISGLDAARERQWARMKQTREVLLGQPITIDGVSFDTRGVSTLHIMGKAAAMRIKSEATTPWVCSDNVVRTVTVEQVEALGAALSDRQTRIIAVISPQLRAQIFDPALTTAAQVEAITWPAT